jgi:hypothetical protein
MSRIAERLARLEATLAEGDEVTVLTIADLSYPIVIDGSPANRVAALKAWYAKHDVPMTKEHAEEVRAFEKITKPTKTSNSKQAKPAKTSTRPSKVRRTKGGRSR